MDHGGIRFPINRRTDGDDQRIRKVPLPTESLAHESGSSEKFGALPTLSGFRGEYSDGGVINSSTEGPIRLLKGKELIAALFKSILSISSCIEY